MPPSRRSGAAPEPAATPAVPPDDDARAGRGVTSKPQRTARGERSRSQLIQAAKEVFERDGFQDARIADIAKQAGMSYGSFYTYFDSKEAVFHEVVHAFTGEMFLVSHGTEEEQRDPVARIREANRAFLSIYARNARVVSIIEEMSTRDPYFLSLRLQIRELFLRRNESGIRALQEAGLADSALDPALAASALGGMVEHFAHVWFVLKQPFDEDVALETLTRLYAHAIGLRLPDEA